MSKNESRVRLTIAITSRSVSAKVRRPSLSTVARLPRAARRTSSGHSSRSPKTRPGVVRKGQDKIRRPRHSGPQGFEGDLRTCARTAGARAIGGSMKATYRVLAYSSRPRSSSAGGGHRVRRVRALQVGRGRRDPHQGGDRGAQSTTFTGVVRIMVHGMNGDDAGPSDRAGAADRLVLREDRRRRQVGRVRAPRRRAAVGPGDVRSRAPVVGCCTASTRSCSSASAVMARQAGRDHGADCRGAGVLTVALTASTQPRSNDERRGWRTR